MGPQLMVDMTAYDNHKWSDRRQLDTSRNATHFLTSHGRLCNIIRPIAISQPVKRPFRGGSP